MESKIKVNEAKSQFELPLDNGMAIIGYELNGDTIAIMHTEVPEGNEGEGNGSKLAKFAMDYARENNLRVKVFCQFVKAFLKHHPEYDDLIIG